MSGLRQGALRFAIVALQRPFEPYQPLYGLAVPGREAGRGCEDRWATISGHLGHPGSQENGGAGRLLDIGTSFGWFALKAAASGWDVDGYDVSRRLIWCDRLLARYTGLANRVRFFNERLLVETIPEQIRRGRLRPVYGATLLLSVIQHIVYSKGVDYARRYLLVLGGMSHDVYVEVPTCRESHRWAASMPADPLELLAPAFDQVELLGTHQPSDRPLYVCRGEAAADAAVAPRK